MNKLQFYSDHEKRVAYQCSIQFVVWANQTSGDIESKSKSRSRSRSRSLEPCIGFANSMPSLEMRRH